MYELEKIFEISVAVEIDYLVRRREVALPRSRGPCSRRPRSRRGRFGGVAVLDAVGIALLYLEPPASLLVDLDGSGVELAPLRELLAHLD